MTDFIFSRRAFMGALAAALPLPWIVREAHATALDDIERHDRTLHALGEAVLPSALGPAGIAASVRGFQQWIAGYRENAELVHGYGTSAITRSGPTPARRWAAQLAALEIVATRAHQRAFPTLGLDERRAIVQGALDASRSERIPSVGNAEHVALGLLAHFYASAAAADLCYEATILRQHCRPLSATTRKPQLLQPVRRT